MRLPSSAQRARSARSIVLRRKDRLRRLRLRADDQRIGDRAQPPAGGDARDLARGVLSVAAGADHRRVGPAVDAVERRHNSCGRRSPSSCPPSPRGSRASRRCMPSAASRSAPCAPGAVSRRTSMSGSLRAPRGGSLRHLARAAGQRVIDDQQPPHGAVTTKVVRTQYGRRSSAAYGCSSPSTGMFLPVDPVRPRRGQEDDDIGDLLGCAETAHRESVAHVIVVIGLVRQAIAIPAIALRRGWSLAIRCSPVRHAARTPVPSVRYRRSAPLSPRRIDQNRRAAATSRRSMRCSPPPHPRGRACAVAPGASCVPSAAD